MMFRASIKIQNRIADIEKDVQRGIEPSLARSAFLVRQTAIESIERAAGPSTPGSPPHTHRAGWLRRAILYSVDKRKMSAVIGPRFSAVGTSATAHEFGGTYKGQTYPRRPFMGPALEKRKEMFASSFSGAVRN